MDPAPLEPVPPNAAKVRAELTRLGYTDLPSALLVTFVIATGLAWFVARAGFPGQAWGWLGVLSVLLLARLATVRTYRRGPAPLLRGESLFLAGAVLTGLAWGYAGWTFYPLLGELDRSLLILLIAGVTAGATRSLSPVLAACMVFQLTALLPLIVRFLLGSEAVQIVMGLLTTVYTTYLLMLARSYHSMLSNSLRLGFDHAALAGELQQKKQVTEELNRGLTSEIERRRVVEDELRTAKERAEAANRAKSDFLATMSHEIRTPMNGVVGMLELLKNTSLDASQAEQVETAIKSADSLLRVLNDILDLSKIEAGSLELESIPFRPAAVAEEVASLLRPRAEEKDIQLKLQVNAASQLRARGDPNRLRQVLLNLVGNAVKFTERGEVALSLQGTVETGTHLAVTIEVRDSGIGMSDGALAKLFQPFTQADSSMSRRYGGSGLGLAISQKLVERMGAKITATSTVGRGSAFRFQVSFALDESGRTVSPFPPAQAPALRFTGRVLVVEDDPVNQRVIAMMLERTGVQCTLVGDGLAALAAVAREPWDLIFMDCQLPGIDGFETTRRIRVAQASQLPPIVALTANVRPEDRAACHAAGMDDFLAKPLRGDVLHACLARWLQPAA